MEKYNLEEEITKVLNISEEIELLTNAIINKKISIDNATKVLTGLKLSVELRFEKIFETYKKTFKLDEYNDEYEDKHWV